MAAERVERPRGSLVNKLRWPIVASVVVVLLIVGYVLIRTSLQAQRQNVFRIQQKTAEEVSLSISAYLQRATDGLNLFAQTQYLMGQERAEQQLAIERLWTQRQNVYDEITLLDRSGNEVAKISRFHTFLPGEFGNLAEATAFQRAMAGEDYLADEVTLSSYSGLPVVEIAIPVRNPDSGDVVGVLIAEASIKRMWDVVAEIQVGETGYAYVVNTMGNLLAHSDLARYLMLQQEDIGYVPVVQRVTAGIVGPEAWEYTGLEGEDVVGAYAPIGGTSWVSIVELPTVEAYASLKQMMVSLLVLLVVAVLAIGGLASWLPQRIVRPLAQLEEGAVLLSSGRLDHRITLHTRDELEALGNAFNEMAGRLQELYAGLEQRVAERTRNLERRSTQLQVAAQVARDAAAARSLDELLNRAVDLIRERFGFYHAGIFLVDDKGAYAVLRAAAGEAGQRMLEHGHRLKVGEVGIVGYVTALGLSRIALDVGDDAVYFDNPFLPETRSEMALPLRAGGEIIGALDVQSREPQAFDEEDVAILQTMADQLAIAIQNARLLQDMQQTVQELETVSANYTQEMWRAGESRGYRYRGLGVETVSAQPPEVLRAWREGHAVVSGAEDGGEGGVNALAVPLKLRDQVMGVLDFRFGGEPVSPETVSLVEEMANRLALALESARLFEETQSRARRERAIRQITEQMRRAVDVETILQTTITRLGEAVGAPRVYVRLGSELELLPEESQDDADPLSS